MVSKSRLESNNWLRKKAPKILGNVLSIGSGDDSDGEGGYYRQYFANCTSYTTSEVAPDRGCDLVLDVKNMHSISDGSFDCIFCSGVLEHVDHFAQALREMHRILIDHGVLLIGFTFKQTTHLAPSEFWRFSEYGVHFALTEFGFAIDGLVSFDKTPDDFTPGFWVRAQKLPMNSRNGATDSGGHSMRNSLGWGEQHNGLFQQMIASNGKVSGLNRSEKVLKVLLALHFPEKLAEGGPTIRLQKTRVQLEKLDISVDITSEDKPEASGYDLVHVFNVWDPDAALRQLRHLRTSHIPIVFSPIYLDLSETTWANKAIPYIFSNSNTSKELETNLSGVAKGRLSFEGLTRYGQNEIRGGYYYQLREMISLTDHIIALSHYEMKRLWATGISPLPYTLVRNAADYRQLENASADLFKNKYGVQDYVLCIGRIERRKNQLMLLQALKDTELQLVLIGNKTEDDYYDLVRKNSGPNVHIIDPISHDDPLLASAYAGARVFALPSWSEGAPLTALEAAAIGLPLVLSDRSSESEYFNNQARYCDPGDIASIRNAVLEAHKQDAKDHSRKQALRELIRTKYNWEAAARDTLTAYSTTLKAFREKRPATKLKTSYLVDVPKEPRKLEIGSGMNPHPGYEHINDRSDLPHIENLYDINKMLPFGESRFNENVGEQNSDGAISKNKENTETTAGRGGQSFSYLETNWRNQPDHNCPAQKMPNNIEYIDANARTFQSKKMGDCQPNGESIRVLYDISVLGISHHCKAARTGIFRVVENIALALNASSRIDLIFCSTQHLSESAPFTSKYCDNYLNHSLNFNKVPFNKSRLPKADIFHSPFHALPNKITTMQRFLTIYDLIPILLPEYIPDQVTELQKMSLARIRPEDHIICISQSTKQDLCSYIKIDPENVFVTPLAASPEVFYPCHNSDKWNSVCRKYNIPDGPYVLSLSTLEPRKNIDHVIRCFAKIHMEAGMKDLNLILVGAKGWDYEKIFNEINCHSSLKERIILPGYVDDNDLASLYSNATVFVYPSYYEGFGLPPLEAMQCGVPVITSATSSLPEVVGDAGVLIDPRDGDALCHNLITIFKSASLRKTLSEKSLLQAKKFTWDECYRKTISAYENALCDRKNIIRASNHPDSKHPNSKTRLDVASGNRISYRQKILIDGVIFQHQRNSPAGISRLWRSLLNQLDRSELGKQIILLDRGSTAPRFSSIGSLQIKHHDMSAPYKDTEYLDVICKENNAALFISTYYTISNRAHSMVMLYDMVPEILGWDLTAPEWKAKDYAIKRAYAYLAISHSTANDFGRFYPNRNKLVSGIIPCAAEPVFTLNNDLEISEFKKKHFLDKPYYLLVGHRWPHKNSILFFKAFSELKGKAQFDIVLTGGAKQLESVFKPFVTDVTCHLHYFSDKELSLAYGGAAALVYPSLYEGFGLPLLEAMQSGCPVITCHNSSLKEVAGDAAIYIDTKDIESMKNALELVQNKSVRTSLINKGLERAKLFSWEESGASLIRAIDGLLREIKASEMNKVIPTLKGILPLSA